MHEADYVMELTWHEDLCEGRAGPEADQAV